MPYVILYFAPESFGGFNSDPIREEFYETIEELVKKEITLNIGKQLNIIDKVQLEGGYSEGITYNENGTEDYEYGSFRIEKL